MEPTSVAAGEKSRRWEWVKKMSMRGPLVGALMLCVGVALTWMLAIAFEQRALEPAAVSRQGNTFAPSLAVERTSLGNRQR